MNLGIKTIFAVVSIVMLLSCSKEQGKLPFGNRITDVRLIGDWYFADTLDDKLYEETLSLEAGAKGEIETLLGGEDYYKLPIGWMAYGDTLWVLLNQSHTMFRYSLSNDSLTLKLDNVESLYIRVED